MSAIPDAVMCDGRVSAGNRGQPTTILRGSGIRRSLSRIQFAWQRISTRVVISKVRTNRSLEIEQVIELGGDEVPYAS